MQLPLRRRPPGDGRAVRPLPLRGERLGRAADGDGESAQNHIHGNCRNTPIEVFETRFPFRTLSYGLVPDSGGPGRHRGGLAVRRDLEVLAPEVTVSAILRPRRARRLGALRRPARPLRGAARAPRRRRPLPRLLRGVRHGQPVEALGRRAARRATSSGSRARAAAASAIRASASRSSSSATCARARQPRARGGLRVA